MADVEVWIHRGPNVSLDYAEYADDAIEQLDNQLSVNIGSTVLGEVPDSVTNCWDQQDTLMSYEEWVESNYTTYDNEHYMLVVQCDMGADIGAGGSAYDVGENAARHYFNSQAAVSVINQGVDGFLDSTSVYNGLRGYKATAIHELCHTLADSDIWLDYCSDTSEDHIGDEHACGEVDSNQACSPMLFWYSENSHDLVSNKNMQTNYVNCSDHGLDGAVKLEVSGCVNEAVEDYVNLVVK